LEEGIASIFKVQKSMSRWLKTEPPVEKTQLYKNRKEGK
jgi:hypothetical protein